MPRSLRAFAAVSAAFALSGCAGIVSPSNYGGRSGVQQELLSETVDQAVEGLALGSRISNRRVYLEVGDLEPEGVASDYVRSAVAAELLRSSSVLEDDPDEADVHLHVKVKSAGVDNSESYKSFLSVLAGIVMWRETMTARVSLEAHSASLTGGELGSASDDAAAKKNTYTETYWFLSIVGPSRSSTVASLD